MPATLLKLDQWSHFMRTMFSDPSKVKKGGLDKTETSRNITSLVARATINKPLQFLVYGANT